jgi:hypothetical protein
MNKKIGRPRVLKRDAKAVLIGARFSPQEAREAENFILDSSQDKSKWLREAVKEKIERQKIRDFVESICRDSNHQNWPKEFEATLIADGLPTSTGIFSLGSKTEWPGHYRPNESYNLRIYPLHQAKLIVSGRTEELLVTSVQPCVACSPPSYHIWFKPA